jgi:signal transduction histidine kinase
MLAYTFMVFCIIYASKKEINVKKILALGIVPITLLVSFPTELNIVSIESYGQNTVAGPIYTVLSPYIALYFIWGLILLFNYYKATQDTQERARIKYIFTGVGLTLVPALAANGVLPAFGVSSIVFYGPNVVIILAIFMSIAIVKHRFLDIRLLVARSIAYLLLVSTLVAIYAAVVFGVTVNVFAEDSVFVRQVVPIIAALFLAGTAPYFKRLFDRITNRIFYRDAYDPQAFLDELNKVLVDSIELNILMRQTSEVVERNLKCATCHVAVSETDKSSLRIVGSQSSRLSRDSVKQIGSELAKLNSKAVVSDELGNSHKNLKKTLNDSEIAMVVSLASGHSPSEKPLAYLLLGPKKSGNIYNKQDLRIIEIIADELVIAIQNALRFEEIQDFAATLQEKVNTATLKLQKTNKKLRDLDETKDEFISMASHQLRTPLTSVKGYTSMVLEGDAGKLNKAQKDLLNQAFVSSQRMVYLIADLLNVSRLKTGKFIIDAQPTNLAEVVEGEISQLRETAKRKNLTLTYDKPKDFPVLMLDETKIRQVIMNFADNAIYYTPRGGKINIGLKEDSSSVYFTVKDDGIGVPKKEQEHMFTKFYRATNARKSRPDGTGLGLFMAKKVVDAQGGHILFESHEGKGSTFGFCFKKKSLVVKETHKSS